MIKKYNVRNNLQINNDNYCLVQKNTYIEIICDYNKIYGLGERFSRINQKGFEIENIVEEKFCNQGEKSYFPLPFFIIDESVGIFINTLSNVTFSFKGSIIIDISNCKENDELIIIDDSFKNIIKQFIKITGSTKPAPKWSFGPWISAHRWNSEEIVYDVMDKLNVNNIPVTVIVLEQWSDEATFYIFNKAKYSNKEVLNYEDYDFSDSPWPDPRRMISNLHKQGIHLLLWQAPVIKKIPSDEKFNQRHYD